MALSKTTLALVVVAALTAQSSARPTYVAKIPNGADVKGVAALGHVDPEGGGPRNKFGLAFAAAGMEWTPELCKADSDGDGQTNGQELGDPCCQWTETGNAKVLWTTGVSAPGDAASKSDPKLWADVKCAGGASNSTSGSTAANSTAGGSAGGAASKAPSASTTPAASTTPSSSSKAPAATTAAPKSAAVGVSTGAAVIALAAATTAAALL